MQASPQRTHRSPGYPTRLEINADPTLLRERLPSAWAGHPELATAAALALTFTLAGCHTPSSVVAADSKACPAGGPAIIAPLFEHGDGFAATGCIIVNPPAYFTEDEAWLIIDAELAKHGINLTEKEYAIPGVEIPLYRSEDLAARKDGDPLPPPVSVAPLNADRADPQHRIALEFVSAENPPEKAAFHFADEFGGTIGSISFSGGAEAMRSEVGNSATEKVFFAALYDPLASSNAKSRRLLRQQVRDFIQWLEAQGAI